MNQKFKKIFTICLIALSFKVVTIETTEARGLITDLLFIRPKDENVIGKIGNPIKNKIPKTFKVMVWNIHKGEDEGFYQDFERLAQGKDLILMQEAVYHRKMKGLLEDINGIEFTTATSFLMLHKSLTGTGVATGSAVAPQKTFFLRTEFSEPVVNTPKLSLFSTYEIAGVNDPLLVVNVHAINFVAKFMFAYEMKRIAKIVNNHKGPVILSGDFNTWSEGRMDVLNELAKQANLKEVVFSPGARSTGLGKILDHAFIRGLNVRKTENHNYITSSDHYPLIFELSTNVERR